MRGGIKALAQLLCHAFQHAQRQRAGGEIILADVCDAAAKRRVFPRAAELGTYGKPVRVGIGLLGQRIEQIILRLVGSARLYGKSRKELFQHGIRPTAAQRAAAEQILVAEIGTDFAASGIR